MRLPRMRFTMGKMLIAVAIVGVLVAWGKEGVSRRLQFIKLYDEHVLKMYNTSEYLEQLVRFNPGELSPQKLITETNRLTAWVKYHESMAIKYEWAGRYPWLPIASDPPEPK